MITVELEHENGKLKMCITALYLNKEIRRQHIDQIVKTIEETAQNVHTIIVREDRIVHYTQIIYSIYQAFRSFQQGTNIARKLSLEVLCYMSCADQIKEAIATLVPDNTRRILVVSFCNNCENDVLADMHTKLLHALKNTFGEFDIVCGLFCTRLTYELPSECGKVKEPLDFMEVIVRKMLERLK